MPAALRTVIFDLGGVLVDWNPRYLYAGVFRDDARMESFLAEACNHEWIHEMDAGKPFEQAVTERIQRFPHYAIPLGLWRTHWEKTIRGPIEDSVAALNELVRDGYRLVALTNWSAETFPFARQRFAFLSLFEDILVSGEHGLAKPDHAIFRLACERWNIRPEQSLFIDDSVANIHAARDLGFQCIHFQAPSSLVASLRQMGLLPSPNLGR
ncbi:MAG: HAD family phosphatase [Betaproteobacteria bacterium]|nr:HAD family phosphatase [Betaproteobacteria bacterium]